MAVLIIIVLVLAALFGLLGFLLEAALWLLLGLIVLGAILGFIVWKWVSGRGGGSRAS